MNKRKITKLDNLKFEPFNKYGEPIKGGLGIKLVSMKKLILVHTYLN